MTHVRYYRGAVVDGHCIYAQLTERTPVAYLLHCAPGSMMVLTKPAYEALPAHLKSRVTMFYWHGIEDPMGHEHDGQAAYTLGFWSMSPRKRPAWDAFCKFIMSAATRGVSDDTVERMRRSGGMAAARHCFFTRGYEHGA
jgi:hypothetical protein